MQIILLLFQLLLGICYSSHSAKKVGSGGLCEYGRYFTSSQCIDLVNGNCSYYRAGQKNSTEASLGCFLGGKKVVYPVPSRCHTPLYFTLNGPDKGLLTWTKKKRGSLVAETYLLNFKLYPAKEQHSRSKRRLLTGDNIPVANTSSALVIKNLIDPLQLYEEEAFSLLLLANQYFMSGQNETIYLTAGAVSYGTPLPAWLNIQQVNTTAIQLVAIPPLGSAGGVHIVALGGFDALNNSIVQALEMRIGVKKEAIIPQNTDTFGGDVILAIVMITPAFCLTKVLVECYFPFLQGPIRPSYVRPDMQLDTC